MSSEWHSDDTAAAYAVFCARHGRYADSSRWLIDAVQRHLPDAATAAGLHGLDWAAGTGETTQAWAATLGALPGGLKADITAFEPSSAMARHHPATRALRRDGVRWRLVQTLPPPVGHGFDAVVGNSMWWLLPDPVAALAGLSPWLTGRSRLAWSTPAVYCGVQPSDAEVALSVCLNDARLACGIPWAEPPPAAGFVGPLDPVGVLRSAGWHICEDSADERSCSPREWLAHTLLPPVQPRWLRVCDDASRAHFITQAHARIAELPSFPQRWLFVVARQNP